MPAYVDLIGGVAAACTTLSFVPQVLKVWRTRSGADISTPMYLLFIVGVGFWLGYGILLRAWPVIVANGVTLVLAATVLGLKVRFERRSVPPGSRNTTRRSAGTACESESGPAQTANP